MRSMFLEKSTGRQNSTGKLGGGLCRMRVTMTSFSPDVSVVVCTQNRSALLGRVCREALQQKLSGQQWELVIVDNCSTDDTQDIARAIESENPENVCVIQETELGLSAARNAGVRSSRGEYVVFLDDDAFPEPGWLQAIVGALQSGGIRCAGGPVQPLFQGELPRWFLGRFLPYLSVWDLGDKERELTYDEYPRGANIGFRKNALEAAGGFCTDLGRKGNNLLSCEETELCLRIERLGGRIVYAPEARVRHLINIERISPTWLIERFEAQGRSEAIINWRHGGLQALIQGTRTFSNRWRAAASEIDNGGDLFARCQRRSFFGYLRGSLPALLTVDRCRWPKGSRPARWAPSR